MTGIPGLPLTRLVILHELADSSEPQFFIMKWGKQQQQ